LALGWRSTSNDFDIFLSKVSGDFLILIINLANFLASSDVVISPWVFLYLPLIIPVKIVSVKLLTLLSPNCLHILLLSLMRANTNPIWEFLLNLFKVDTSCLVWAGVWVTGLADWVESLFCLVLSFGGVVFPLFFSDEALKPNLSGSAKNWKYNVFIGSPSFSEVSISLSELWNDDCVSKKSWAFWIFWLSIPSWVSTSTNDTSTVIPLPYVFSTISWTFWAANLATFSDELRRWSNKSPPSLDTLLSSPWLWDTAAPYFIFIEILVKFLPLLASSWSFKSSIVFSANSLADLSTPAASNVPSPVS